MIQIRTHNSKVIPFPEATHYEWRGDRLVLLNRCEREVGQFSRKAVHAISDKWFNFTGECTPYALSQGAIQSFMTPAGHKLTLRQDAKLSGEHDMPIYFVEYNYHAPGAEPVGLARVFTVLDEGRTIFRRIRGWINRGANPETFFKELP